MRIGDQSLGDGRRLPGSQFLGIDFVGAEIEAGQALAAEAGLENAKFEQADLLSWQPGDEKYDYIIAYGLFSWVPDQVKDRLFQVCRECLAPDGMACISYMTYPGCKQPERSATCCACGRKSVVLRKRRSPSPTRCWIFWNEPMTGCQVRLIQTSSRAGPDNQAQGAALPPARRLRSGERPVLPGAICKLGGRAPTSLRGRE